MLAISRNSAIKITTSRTGLYSTGMAMWNETVAHVLHLYFLFLSQSWSTVKKIAAINGASLKKTTFIVSQKNSCYPHNG